MQRRAHAGIALLMIVCAAAGMHAHEIPNDVTIHAYVRPEGRRLELVVRAPVAAMRDVVFPTHHDGTLDLARADAAVRHSAMLWLADAIALYEDASRLPQPRILATRISLPSDRAFASYASARTHLAASMPDDTRIVPTQALMDVLFEYDIQSDRSAFAVDPRFARLGLRVVTVLRLVPPAGAERAFELVGDPGLVRLDPRWHQAAWRFVKLGFVHILEGTDHLLFLLCLVIPFRRLRPLLIVVTAFTLAHSITLIASALDMAPDALWFPPLIETAIAASIVFMALENIVGSEYLRRIGRVQGPMPFKQSGVQGPPLFKRRWAMALAFGLVHGFGFSFALQQTMQFAGSHLMTSLLAFNLGVEIGQIAVLLVLVPALGLLFRYVVAERVGTIILSAIVAHTGWHWTTERWTTLAKFEWPAVTAAGVASALGWVFAALALAAIVWGASLAKRLYPPSRVALRGAGRESER
jgi:HupE / UreJ protein